MTISYTCNIANVNANAPALIYSILFESNVYVYKEHTVTISSNGLYEIYKLVFWPTTKAKRYNSSEFSFSTTPTKSSDSIGGLYHWYGYSENLKYYQKNFECSKFWVYHHVDKYYDDITITYDGKSYNASQVMPNRVRCKLVFDSDEFAYKSINLTCYCFYYHTEPSELEYIDKNFYITLPYIQIFVAPNSKISQISGCNFSHISEILDYFIRLCWNTR